MNFLFDPISSHSGISTASARLLPPPVADFQQVLTVLIDIVLVLDKLVLNHLFQLSTLGTQMRQAIHHVLHQMKAVQIVLHAHIKGRRNGAFFLVAAHVQISIGAAVGQPVD
jgi:hypothetical protein